MIIFACHASTHMVGAGDTWVAMACGRHFINHGVDTVEPFSANSHKAGPTEQEIKTWPGWAQSITKKVGLDTVKYWHPTGWINQNWLTHVIFYWLTSKSPFADADTYSFNTLVYWKFAIYIITVICVYYTGKTLGVYPPLSAAFACFAMFAGRSFFDIRPAGFSNLLTAVFLLILILTTYRNILYIWLVVPIVVFWCNVHGGYIYAFIVLAPFIMLHLLATLPRRWTVSLHSILIWGASYALAYKFLNHEYFLRIRDISPPHVGTDWLFYILLLFSAASVTTATLAAFKKIKNEVFYAYHILALIIAFFCVLPRFIPSVPLTLTPEFQKAVAEHIAGSQLSFVIVFFAMIGLGVVLAFFKTKVVCINAKGIIHTIAASFVAFIAMVVFNPFHLTNLTHTFVVSVSRHAEKWRTVNEWHPAFEWSNPVGTSFPFLLLYILSIGLTLFWLYSRLLKPRLLKAPKYELEKQRKLFITLSKIFGCAAAVFICWATFIGFSFLSVDVLSFVFCALFVGIVLLSIYKNVHFIYFILPLVILAVAIVDPYWVETLAGWFDSPQWLTGLLRGHNGRYIYPFVLLPVYVVTHILISLFSKTVRIKPENIIFPAATAIVTLFLMVAIFNPFKFGFVFGLRPQFRSHLDRPVVSKELRQKFEQEEIQLSENATISVEKAGRKWLITDEPNKYTVRKEQQAFNIYKYGSPVWKMRQDLHLRRTWVPQYEGRYRLRYTHLFTVLYIINIASVVIWFAVPYLRSFFSRLEDKIEEGPQPEPHQLPKIDLALMAIAVLTIYMAIRSRRFIPIAAIAACPILAMFIEQMARTISSACSFHGLLPGGSQNVATQKQNRLTVPPMPTSLQMFFNFVVLIAVLGFGTWWTLKFKFVYLDPWPRNPKLTSAFMRMTDSHRKPFYALKFINDNKLEGKMFNYWTEGGFIAYGQDPDPKTGKTPLQLFMDGRAQAAYMRRAYQVWSDIMFGGPRVQSVRQSGGQYTREDYTQIGRWIDKQLTDYKVWVVLMPVGQFRTAFVRSLEYHLNWQLIFVNNNQKIFVDTRTPQAAKLFRGILNGQTLYPDDFSRNLIIAHIHLAQGKSAELVEQGFDFALKAFELNPSPAPMQEIIVAARYPKLAPRVHKFCRDYLDEFANNKAGWAKKNGYENRITAALIAADYLQKLARMQKNTELDQEYAAKRQQYSSEQIAIISAKGW